MTTDIFIKRVCRLCESAEVHSTGINSDTKNCYYWLSEEYDEVVQIKGLTHGREVHEFWIPVFYCPWCGRKLK